MKLSMLGRSGRSPQLPLRLQLPDGELLLLQWLRVLPGRRYVARAEWQGQQVLAKLLVGRKAARNYRREQQGAQALASQGLVTPALLASGYRGDAGAWLLFDYLENAVTLDSRWQEVAAQPPLSASQQAVLGDALAAIAGLHAKGLWQDDLHLDNLLCKNGALHWVDAGSVRSTEPGRPLAATRALANLGVFFAQLPTEFDAFIPQLLQHYQRGDDRPVLPLAALQQQVARSRQWRMADFLGKLGRDCSLFSVQRGPARMQAVLRSEALALQPLLDDPDRFIAAGEILKAGRTSTVARVSLHGRILLIKRYNIKGLVHWLRRFWRPSRAWHAWREGHRLRFLGMATPLPLAILERRCGWLRGRAYLVTEFLAGENILARFFPYVHGAPPTEELASLDQLFATLRRARISHGDLKGSNLIWHNERWALIDLDAMRQHAVERVFARAYARDRERFLRNWPADSPLYQLLDQRIPEVPGTSPA